MCLKLLKSGQVVASQEIKSHFLNAAKEIKILSDQDLIDPKKLQLLKDKMDSLLEQEGKEEQDIEDISRYFRRLDRRFNKMKEGHERDLIEMFEEFTKHKAEDYSAQASHTSIMQKQLKVLMSEIWVSVIPTVCPHCEGKSPGFRKDGSTKIFQKAFSDKMKNQILQKDRIKGKRSSSKSRQSGETDATLELITETSTTTRKHSHTIGDQTTDYSVNDDIEERDSEEDNEDEQEDNEMDAAINQTSQIMLTPLEVKDHIYQLWQREKELLSLMYGRYYPSIDGEPYVNDSLGPQMFFMHKMLVPPNRFRPESQGGFGGGAAGGQGDKAYLHAHSALLQKIINLNLALKDAFLGTETYQRSDKTQRSETIQKWI